MFCSYEMTGGCSSPSWTPNNRFASTQLWSEKEQTEMKAIIRFKEVNFTDTKKMHE